MIDHLKIKVSQFQKLLTNNFSKFFFWRATSLNVRKTKKKLYHVIPQAKSFNLIQSMPKNFFLDKFCLGISFSLKL